MADPTEVHVTIDPKPTQQKGDWTVVVGRPGSRGSKHISSHREKDAAVKRARREGRKRADHSGGAVLKVHKRGRGRPRVEARYGAAQDRGMGERLFGGLF